MAVLEMKKKSRQWFAFFFLNLKTQMSYAISDESIKTGKQISDKWKDYP